jgi:hypothetical protein
MNAPSPDKFSRELLAAYADGELDGDRRALVEQWLAEHPGAEIDLQTQRELSASNSVLWEAAEPPAPTALDWAIIRWEIDAELAPRKTQANGRTPRLRTVGKLFAGLALSGAAAALIWLAFVSTPQTPQNVLPARIELVQETETRPEIAPVPHSPDADPLASIAVLPIPTDDEVTLDRVPVLHEGWLPVGQHPVPGMLILATVEELYLEDSGPISGGTTNGGPKMTNAPGDAPMIFAAKQRR